MGVAGTAVRLLPLPLGVVQRQEGCDGRIGLMVFSLPRGERLSVAVNAAIKPMLNRRLLLEGYP